MLAWIKIFFFVSIH